MTYGANSGLATGVATDYPAPRPVDDEVGEIREGKYIAVRDFAITEPGLASWMPRLQVPSRNKVGALEAPGKTHTDRGPMRRRRQRRELRNRHVRDDLQPVGLVMEGSDPRFAQNQLQERAESEYPKLRLARRDTVEAGSELYLFESRRAHYILD